MPYKQVFLKPKKEESLKRFHPWVFSGAIDRIDGVPEEGEIVRIYDSQKNFLALGHCQIGSIAIRILSFLDTPIDGQFWENRFSNAWKLRKTLGLTANPPHSIYRLVHGEGDLLPGLIVDVYGKSAVMQAHSPGMHWARHELASALKNVLGDSLDNIYYKSESTLPFKAELEAQNEYLYGGTEVDKIALENNLRFYVDWEKGQKTGFFIDQRENRMLLQRYASGKEVLNMFCYTGGFSVYALQGGAKEVVSVDSSARAMDLTKRNVSLNFPDDPRHTPVTEDAFRYLEQMKKDQYDLIVLDPPAFAKHRNVLKNALQGYKKLNASAIGKIRPGGVLFTFSCSQAVSRDNFRLSVFSAAAQAKRNVKILHQLSQPADHPINIYHPEGEYLKGLILEIE